MLTHVTADIEKTPFRISIHIVISKVAGTQCIVTVLLPWCSNGQHSSLSLTIVYMHAEQC